MSGKVKRYITLYTDVGAQINSLTYMLEDEINRELHDKDKETIELLGLSEDDSFVYVSVQRHRVIGSAHGTVPGERKVAPVKGIIQ